MRRRQARQGSKQTKSKTTYASQTTTTKHDCKVLGSAANLALMHSETISSRPPSVPGSQGGSGYAKDTHLHAFTIFMFEPSTPNLFNRNLHTSSGAYLLHETGQSNIRANRPNKALTYPVAQQPGWVGGKAAATSADTQATVLRLGPTDPTAVQPLNTTGEYVEEG